MVEGREAGCAQRRVDRVAIGLVSAGEADEKVALLDRFSHALACCAQYKSGKRAWRAQAKVVAPAKFPLPGP
jgi:hypothetical protein